MVAPRNMGELVKVLLQDAELRRTIHALITRVDAIIEEKTLKAMQGSLNRYDIDLALLDGDEVGRAIKAYYREIRAAGQFVKLW